MSLQKNRGRKWSRPTPLSEMLTTWLRQGITSLKNGEHHHAKELHRLPSLVLVVHFF